MGLGEGFPQLVVFALALSGSPQPAGASVDFPHAAVPLSTVGLDGEVPPQPDGSVDTLKTQFKRRTSENQRQQIQLMFQFFSRQEKNHNVNYVLSFIPLVFLHLDLFYTG